MILHRAKARMYEYACHEGNYAIENMLGGARRLEAQARVQGKASPTAK